MVHVLCRHGMSICEAISEGVVLCALEQLVDLPVAEGLEWGLHLLELGGLLYLRLLHGGNFDLCDLLLHLSDLNFLLRFLLLVCERLLIEGGVAF